MSLLTPTRIDEPELLDEHDAPRDEMERSLRDLRRINRYLGGIGIYRRLLRRMIPDPTQPLVVVDLGTGTSDLLDSLRDYPRLLPIGVDFKIDHVLYLRRGSRTRRVVADAHHLPFRDGSVDVVTSAHFFHHFTPDGNAHILGESLRIARQGVIVNDTRRHHVPLLMTRLLGWLRLVGRITRFDAPGSVLRAYTTEEARAVAERAGARKAQTINVWPFRFGLLLWK